MSNKVKLLIDNFFIYGIGSVISKIIPLVMLPILTRLYPSAEYMGLNDLVMTISYFGSAIAVLGINNAMFRLFFEDIEKEKQIAYQKNVCSSALSVVCTTTIFVVIIAALLRKQILALFLGDNNQYSSLVSIAIICIFNDSLKNIISTPSRMENRRKVFLAINVISPLFSYSLALLFICKGMYVYGLPLAMLISAIVENLFFAFLNHKWFSLHSINLEIIIQLCKIAVPLAPNFLIYWVFNSCDKVMIQNLLGTYDVGVYSVAAKFGHASQIIYTAFASGWSYFAFSTMNEKNQERNNSLVFEYLSVVALSATAVLCMIVKPVWKLLFPEEYIEAVYVIPYLFLAPLSMMLYQVLSNQFLVIKKTLSSTLILFAAAIVNIGLNYFLIKPVGIEGAAIATLAGYLCAILLCACVLKKKKLFFSNYKTGVMFVLFGLCFMVWRVFLNSNTLISIIPLLVFGLGVIILYKNDFSKIIANIRS